jgi:hypothetical protein
MDDVLSDLGMKVIKKRFATFIVEKALVQNVTISESNAAEVVDRLLSWKESDGDTIVIDGVEENIEISEQDLNEFLEKCDYFINNEFPEIVDKALEASSDDLFVNLKDRWPAERDHQAEERAGFKKRLKGRWGEALDLLGMLLTVGREIGLGFGEKHVADHGSIHKVRDYVLLRLHARSCQIVEEIKSLLESGLADGAMARWRTLHEVSVVMTLIREYGSELAQRYLDHDLVEARRFLHNYLKTYEALGFEAIPQAEIDQVEASYARILALHGESFARDYGWAAKHLSRSNSFADLAEAAGRAHISTHYRMASQNVHAGIKGITNKLGSLKGSGVLVAGLSDAGLEEPGQCTAHSFTLVNLCLIDIDGQVYDDLTRVMQLKIVANLQKETVQAFVSAGARLQRDYEESLKPKRKAGWRRRREGKSRTGRTNILAPRTHRSHT